MLTGTSETHAQRLFKIYRDYGTCRVIENAETLKNLARRRALEDALYLAALHGGAKINGFSAVNTDTSIQENLVVQPASQILDHNVISEQQTDTHFIIKKSGQQLGSS